MDAAAWSHSLILVNLLFAVLAMGIGFFAGAWFLGGRTRKPSGQVALPGGLSLEQTLANERVSLASSRLRDLASGMASDVDDHSSRVEQITADLRAAEDASAEQQTLEVALALSRIIEANENLQSKLAKAEQQIEAQAKEIRNHESEARTDSLTGLSNRRAFDSQIEQRFAEWSRTAQVFSLIILDVDHFKKFNDTHGHQAGDEVLRQVAKALLSAAREMDVVARYGGEEFAIICPATSAQDAVTLVERARCSIEALAVSFEEKTLNVTASFGLAEIGSDDSPQALLKRADEALYAAKDAGRNRGFRNTGQENVPVTSEGQGATPTTHGPKEKVMTRLLDKLPNRTRFIEELRRRIAAVERSNEPLSVLAIDLPGFGQIRADYGDAIALLTLDSLAQFLANSLREMDLLGRLDEGQFVMMLPSAKADEAEVVAKRAAKALAGCSVPMGDQSIQLSTRMGVAQHRPEDSAASLVHRACQKMRAEAQKEAAV